MLEFRLYVCMHVCTKGVCLHICACHLYVYMYLCMITNVSYVYARVCVCVCEFVCLCACVCMCVIFACACKWVPVCFSMCTCAWRSRLWSFPHMYVQTYPQIFDPDTTKQFTPQSEFDPKSYLSHRPPGFGRSADRFKEEEILCVIPPCLFLCFSLMF